MAPALSEAQSPHASILPWLTAKGDPCGDLFRVIRRCLITKAAPPEKTQGRASPDASHRRQAKETDDKHRCDGYFSGGGVG